MGGGTQWSAHSPCPRELKSTVLLNPRDLKPSLKVCVAVRNRPCDALPRASFNEGPAAPAVDPWLAGHLQLSDPLGTDSAAEWPRPKSGLPREPQQC